VFTTTFQFTASTLFLQDPNLYDLRIYTYVFRPTFCMNFLSPPSVLHEVMKLLIIGLL